MKTRCRAKITWTMKVAQRILITHLLLCCLACAVISRAWSRDPATSPQPANSMSKPLLTAESAILMDMTTGTVLWEKNADVRRPPASLTKIMTGLLLLEDGRLGDWVTVTPSVNSAWGSLAGLKPGDGILQRDLLYAILLKSANDACIVSAEHVGGTVDGFVTRMNQRATELGATNTHFTNPHGLHSDTHLTTARDLAIIARYAMQNPEFQRIVKMKAETIHWQGTEAQQTLRLINKNRLLWRWDEADGVKTGYTKQAGRCLVASATHKGWQLLAVVMKAANTWDESAALLKWGFANYVKVSYGTANSPVAEATVGNGEVPHIAAVPQEPLDVVVPKERAARVHWRVRLRPQTAPLKKGKRVGWATAENGGHALKRVPLVAAQEVRPALIYRAAPFLATIGATLACLLMVRLSHGTTSKSPR